MALFFILACTLIFVAIASYVQYARWQKGKGRLGGHEKASSSSSKLPPGSMGWPYLGDTLQLYSQDPNVFFASKQKRLVAVPVPYRRLAIHAAPLCRPSPSFAHSRLLPGLCRYGEIFKTHLLGCPCVMLASPEAARFVLVTQAHLFKPTYPRSKERMIGPSALFFHQGDYHLRLRKLVQGALGPDALRALVPEVESAVRSTLAAWDGQVRSTFHAMKTVSN
jgi:(+)-abscisic acid 8'-hydroxylase